ncbi:MAG: hypothetical protein LQ343_005309 [Gyalolechia ehrenbergii]|nr:MAG: hypothetical protein LQ343_005309 [Gyalolechia ehrenbergii]
MTVKKHYKYEIPAFSSVPKYYDKWESRIGYQALLGGTRHFGYWVPGTIWPFPLSAALRRMEDRLYDSLDLPTGSTVLDAGCGIGHVALHLAHKGLKVQAFDITENHVRWAQEEVKRQGMQHMVSVGWGDYHNLNGMADGSFDGVYTMETLFHSMDPARAVSEMYRVLKPGGHIVFHEYDHIDATKPPPDCPRDLVEAIIRINTTAGGAGFHSFDRGDLPHIMEDQGFSNITACDLTENIRPLMRLFWFIAYVPYLLIRLLGLQLFFVNTESGVQGYRALKMGYWRYMVYTARKPAARDGGADIDGARQRRVG